MERIDGDDMSKLIEKFPRNTREYTQEILKLWPTEEAFIDKIIIPLVIGIKCLHKNGIAHRDIKPANIMIDKSYSNAVILDLGVACLNNCGTLVQGTPNFYPPELVMLLPSEYREGLYTPKTAYNIKRSDLDNIKYSLNADVWAIGATVFEILYGLSLNEAIIENKERKDVPSEIRDLSPLIVAIAYLFKDPERFDLQSWKRVWIFLNACLSEDPEKRKEAWDVITPENIKTLLAEGAKKL